MLTVVLAGCGGISRVWLEPLKKMNDVTLLGLVDISLEQAKKQADTFALDVPIATDLAEMIAKTKPDVVFDCTVPTAHYDVTLTALRAGCHVFGEKAMADDMGQASEMVRAARASGKTYAVMQNRRYDPNIGMVRGVLESGLIGEITTVHADFFIGAHFGGFRDKMAHVLIKDMAIHTFDSARFLTGCDATSVYCHEWNPKGSWYDRDASAVAIFEMTSGVVFCYRGSWCAEGLRTPWESQWRIIGSRGTLVWDGATGLRCEHVDKAEGFLYEQASPPLPTLVTSDFPDWHAASIRAFVDAVKTGLEPQTVCTDNIRSLAMVLAAVESSEKRQRIDISIEV
jgi:predicted dehydrogenase